MSTASAERNIQKVLMHWWHWSFSWTITDVGVFKLPLLLPLRWSQAAALSAAARHGCEGMWVLLSRRVTPRCHNKSLVIFREKKPKTQHTIYNSFAYFIPLITHFYHVQLCAETLCSNVLQIFICQKKCSLQSFGIGVIFIKCVHNSASWNKAHMFNPLLQEL